MTDNITKFETTEFEKEWLTKCLKWLNEIHHGCANYYTEEALIASYNVFHGIHLPRETANRIAFAIEGDNRFNKYVRKLKDDENFEEPEYFDPEKEY